MTPSWQLWRFSGFWKRLTPAGKVLVCLGFLIILTLIYVIWPSAKRVESGGYETVLIRKITNLYYCPECNGPTANCFPSCLCPETRLDTLQQPQPAQQPPQQPTPTQDFFNPEDMDAVGCPSGYIMSRRGRGGEGESDNDAGSLINSGVGQLGIKRRKEAYVFYFSLQLVPKGTATEKEFLAFLASFQVAIYSVKRSGTTRPIVVIWPEGEEKLPRWRKFSKYMAWLTEENSFFTLVRVKRGSERELEANYHRRLAVFGVNFDRVIILNEDALVLKNMDILFKIDHTPAFVFNHSLYYPQYEMNRLMGGSGLMVVDPSPKLYTAMIDYQPTILQYDDTDVGYIMSFFRLWYQIPAAFHFDKFLYHPEYLVSDLQKQLLSKIYSIRFRGKYRPFACPNRTDDCNSEPWRNSDGKEEKANPFQSHEMHRMWWKFYTEMVESKFFTVPPLPYPGDKKNP